MRSFHRSLAVSLAVFASGFVLAFAAAPASAQVESLQGESFVGADVDVEGACAPPGIGDSTFTFRAEGLAVGPYPGTFIEEGRFAVESAGRIRSFESSFTIFVEDELGQRTGEVVTGTKTLIFGFGQCRLGFVSVQPRLFYQATIRTDAGNARDTGESTASVAGVACFGGPCATGDFFENFTRSHSLLPFFTTGKATGGGQILDARTQEHVTFGFEVKSTEDPNRLQGRCLVRDLASDTQVKCLNVTSYEEIGNTATWEGTADVNGVREHYRITVQDNGEPDQVPQDTFVIDTESYDAGGPVVRGNVQLHKQTSAL